jgi:hypothetical protein
VEVVEVEAVKWVEARDHPVFKKFFKMVGVVGKSSVHKRMTALGFDSTILDSPRCMVVMEGFPYPNKRIPKILLGWKILLGAEDEGESESGDEGSED